MIKNKYILIIFCVIGLCVFLYYKLSNMFSKHRGEKVSKKCIENIDYAIKLSESLDFLYDKRDFNEQIFYNKIRTISENFQLEEHKVLLLKKIDSKNYLLVTYCSEMDYNITFTGKIGDIYKLEQFNFRLFIDKQNNFIYAYSEPYYDRNDKNIRENFLRKLFKYLLIE